MKKYAILFIIVIIIFTICNLIIMRQNNDIKVQIDTLEHSIINSNNKKIAVIYFDKPTLYGNSKIVSKINEYFQTEYEDWLNGTQKSTLGMYYSDSMNVFLNSVNSMITANKENELEKNPLKYTVTSEIAFFDGDILSIKQYVFWDSGGPHDYNCFGSTFNLKTGEMIPFTYFYDTKTDDFRDLLSEFIISNKISNLLSDDKIREIIGSNTESNFYYPIDNCNGNLSYEYFFDGEFIYLTLNRIELHSSVIIRWDGKNFTQMSFQMPR